MRKIEIDGKFYFIKLHFLLNVVLSFNIQYCEHLRTLIEIDKAEKWFNLKHEMSFIFMHQNIFNRRKNLINTKLNHREHRHYICVVSQ